MAEKLTTFLKLYSDTAAADVGKLKPKIAENEEQVKRIPVLYKEALATATGLGQAKTFTSVFGTNGIFKESTETVTIYSTLLKLDDAFDTQLKELYKLRSANIKLEGRKQNLLIAESYVKKGGDDYLNKLANEILAKASAAGSRGANFTSIIDKLFKSYEDYEKSIEGFTEDIAGPDGMLTAPETYAALVEKKEAGQFNAAGSAEPAKGAPSQLSKEEQSAINESEGSSVNGETGSAESKINPSKPTSAPVNSATPASPINATSPSTSESTSTTSSE